MSLLEAFKQVKAADPDGPLFTASATEKRRAQAVYDAWMARAKRSGIMIELVRVTPALAEIILSKNENNRKVSKIQVKRLATDMTGGRFLFNGDAVRLTSKGGLLDGQHRCHACIASGVSFDAIVIVGIETDAQQTIDQQLRRTAAHQLGMLGYKDPSNVAHAGRIYWMLKERGTVIRNLEHQPTYQQILETIEEHQALTETAYGHKAWKAHLGGVGLHVAMRLWCANIGGDAAADKFFTPLVSSLGFKGKTDPAYMLHKALSERERLTEKERAAFVIKAWNAYRRGQPLRQLKFLAGEEFPTAE